MSADILDQASDLEQRERDTAIATARQQAARQELPPSCGQCFNCESSVPPGVRYCDSECRDTHEHRKRRELANVKRYG